MTEKVLFESLAPVSQDARAVEQWAKSMRLPNPRADIFKLVDSKALVRSRDGSKQFPSRACPPAIRKAAQGSAIYRKTKMVEVLVEGFE